MTTVACAAVLGLAISSARTQDNVPPTVTLRLAAQSVPAGSLVPGILTVTFAPGLHAYQNPPSKDFQIPVSVSGPSFLMRRYPAGQLHVVAGETEASFTYSGMITIPVLLQAPLQPGPARLSLRVRYQQCNDNACFPPGSVTAEAALDVKPETRTSTARVAARLAAIADWARMR